MFNDENTADLEQLDTQDQDVETTESTDTDSEDTTDWKSEALKYKAILDRNKNKPRTETKTQTKSSGELDYGQKAFLVANGIKGSDEMKLAHSIMRESGKDLESVLESKYFQSELSELRQLRSTSNAVPTGSKRGGQTSVDTVDYWIAKGELPPKSEVELRRKVVNARIDKENKSPFYNS